MVPFRCVHIRSKKVVNNSSMCIVDSATFWRGATRNAFGQPCNEAAKMADGRDMWFVHD